MPINAKVCYLCGKPIKDGVQYLTFARKITEYEWEYHAKELGGKAGNPALCMECNERLRKTVESMRNI